jgi:hypothetical protein
MNETKEAADCNLIRTEETTFVYDVDFNGLRAARRRFGTVNLQIDKRNRKDENTDRITEIVVVQ